MQTTQRTDNLKEPNRIGQDNDLVLGLTPEAWALLKANPWLASAARCKKEFHFFVEHFWDEIVKEEYKPNWHIEYVCSELQIVAERVFAGLPSEYDLIINIPPGTTKSLICSVFFPVWIWLRLSSAKIISGSYSSELSLEHSQLSRDLIRSDTFQMYYPHLLLRRDKDAKSNYKNTQGGARIATSTGGTITGFHAHIIIADDPINPKKAVSVKELQNANDWMDRTLSSRKVDKELTPTILIMQRLHESDPTGNMLAKQKDGKKVKHICLPGEDSYPIYPAELRYNYVDGMLDPVRLNRKALTNMKLDLGTYGYAGQIGQDPKPIEGGLFDRVNFTIVSTCPWRLKRLRWWDLAATEEAGNNDPDWTVGALCGISDDNRFYIIDIQRVRKTPGQVEKLVKQVTKLDARIDKVVGEHHCQVWMEQEGGSSGKNTIHTYTKLLVGYAFRGQTSTGNKLSYADPLSAQVEAGNVYLVEGAWNSLFLAEAELFPNAAHDDQVDAVSKAFAKLYTSPKRAGTWGSKR